MQAQSTHAESICTTWKLFCDFNLNNSEYYQDVDFYQIISLIDPASSALLLSLFYTSRMSPPTSLGNSLSAKEEPAVNSMVTKY